MSEKNIPDELQEIINDFISEGRENLAELERVFVDLENDPKNLELINTIFRAVHSLKGAADFLGFKRMVAVAHKTESLLNRLRKETLTVTPEIMDVVFAAVDLIKVLLEEIESGDENADIDTTVNRIAEILEAREAGQKEQVEFPPSHGTLPKDADNRCASSDTERKKEKEDIEVSAATAAEKVPAPEEEADTSPAATKTEKVRAPETSQQSSAPDAGQTAQASMKDQTIRVDVARLDSVMNLVGELVLARNRMFKTNQELQSALADNPLIQSLTDNSLHLSLLTTDLQLAVLKTRMQPMRKVFSKFPRMVRDLARKKKKEINLDISGEDTEVDRSIIEEIGDPLVHMIRNSIDHGIEIPDFREPLGKPEKGLIRLCASYEGDHIIIEVSDDGKGLDPAKLRKTSVEKGILSEEEAEKLSDKESLNLIFAPGFSTAERVTDTSGRGVGMDVVKSNIAKLNGIVNVESTLGEGTKFRIRLPLTVAIIQALMVGAADEIYALSLGSVIETLRVTREEIKTVDDTEVISLRDEILPLTYLATEMGLPRGDDEAAEHMYVVVAGVAEKKIGLVVSKLYGQEEIVIKPLGNYLKGHREFSGATLTGDGKVIMILDVGGLMGVRAVV
jgi:two-component system chemotaxis sensor kinase CheA